MLLLSFAVMIAKSLSIKLLNNRTCSKLAAFTLAEVDDAESTLQIKFRGMK